MSHILELLGRGVGEDLGDLLDRYFRVPPGEDIEVLRETCRREPEQGDCRRRLGVACLRAAEPAEAAEHLAAAVAAGPDDLGARLALATARDEQGRPAEALEQLTAAARLRPGEAPILFAKGFCLEKLNRPAKAAEAYTAALAADEDLLAARERLAAIAVLRAEPETAADQYRALRDACPETIGYRAALAHLLYRAGSHAEAVDEYETALAMEPENWALVDDEVEALVAEGEIERALDRLGALIEDQGPFPDLHVRAADLYSRRGDDDAAMAHYHAALNLQPDYLEATVRLGTHHLVNGRWEEAAESFHRAGELNDRVLLCYVGMGVAQAAMGERSDAMNSFDLASAVEPNSTLLLAEMTKLQLKSAVADAFANSFATNEQASADGLSLGADELLRRQVARHADEARRRPDHPDVRYRYGVLLRAGGRIVDAVEQFRHAVRLSPAFAKAWVSLGVCQQEMGLVAEAVSSFTQAMDIRREQIELHYRLGLLYTHRETFEQSVRQMEAAADGGTDEQIRAGLALSLQTMGLMDPVAATWRSLWRMHRARAG